jgi:hypothetical protein
MNERIEKLAEQCGFRSNPDLYDRNQSFDIPKFAELIVRECLGCSNNLINHYIDNHSEKEQVLLLASIADYSSEIQKHFGVAE